MKKLGKFLLFTASACAAAAGIYYYVQNKEKFSNHDWDDDDDDYDDFSDDLEDDEASPERSYVPLPTDIGETDAATTDTVDTTVESDSQ